MKQLALNDGHLAVVKALRRAEQGPDREAGISMTDLARSAGVPLITTIRLVKELRQAEVIALVSLPGGGKPQTWRINRERYAELAA